MSIYRWPKIKETAISISQVLHQLATQLLRNTRKDKSTVRARERKKTIKKLIYIEDAQYDNAKKWEAFIKQWKKKKPEEELLIKDFESFIEKKKRSQW